MVLIRSDYILDIYLSSALGGEGFGRLHWS